MEWLSGAADILVERASKMRPKEWLEKVLAPVEGGQTLENLVKLPMFGFDVPLGQHGNYPWLQHCISLASERAYQVLNARQSLPVDIEAEARAVTLAAALAEKVDLPVQLGDEPVARKSAWLAALTDQIQRPSVSIHFPVVFANSQAAILRLKLYALPDTPGVVVMAPLVNHPDNPHSLLSTHVGRSFLEALKEACQAAKPLGDAGPEGVAWSLESVWKPDHFPDATAWVDGPSVGVAAFLAFRAFYEHHPADLHTVCATGAIVKGETESVAEVTAKHEAFTDWSQGIMARHYLADRLPDNVDTKKCKLFSSRDEAWRLATNPVPPPVLSTDPQIEAAYKSSLRVQAGRCRKVFGREEDVENVQCLVREQGSGGLIVVHGPAGVGKSSFIGELVNHDWGDAAVARFNISQREPATSDWDRIHQALLAQLHAEGIGEESTTLRDFVRDYEGKRIVVVIDGVDEASVDPQGIWTWEISKQVTVLLGVRGTGSQVAERLPIVPIVGPNSHPRPCHYYSLANLARPPFDHWIGSALEHAELPEVELGAVTQALWDRTEGYPLFTDRLLGQLQTATEPSRSLLERVEDLPKSLVDLVRAEWRSMKRTAGWKWIPAIVAARGAIDQAWLDRLPRNLKPGPLAKAGEPVQRWVLETRASDLSLDPGTQSDARARSVVYDLGHPALREAFEQVEGLQEQISAIEACVLEKANKHIQKRANDEHYRWEDAVGVDRYDARYLMDHVLRHLEHIQSLMNVDPNRACPLLAKAQDAIRVIIGDADFWSGWVHEVVVSGARRNLIVLMQHLRALSTDAALIEEVETLCDWLDATAEHRLVGVSPLILAANHAGLLPVSVSARRRLEFRREERVIRRGERTVAHPQYRVTALCKGEASCFSILDHGFFIVATDAGVVAVFDNNGLPVDYTKTQETSVRGKVGLVVPLVHGRFAVCTDAGVVAVFDRDGEPVDTAKTHEASVYGAVREAVVLENGRFAVCTNEGVVAVFDSDGAPVDPAKTQEASVVGSPATCILIDNERFVLCTYEGVVAVFDNNGAPLDQAKTQDVSVRGSFPKCNSLNNGRFAVCTDAGVVAVFDRDGEPVDTAKTHVASVYGAVREVVVLENGRFAVCTNEGVVAVFDIDGAPVDPAKTHTTSVVGKVCSMLALAGKHFVVSTDSGVVAVFDIDGVPTDQSKTTDPSWRDWPSELHLLDQENFVVGDSLGLIAVFKCNRAQGSNYETRYWDLSDGWIWALKLISERRFVVGTTSGDVALFDCQSETSHYQLKQVLRVRGGVQWLGALDLGRVVAITDEGMVIVVDTSKMSEKAVPSDRRSLDGMIWSMTPISPNLFAVGTETGAVAVFQDDGTQLQRSESREVRVVGCVVKIVPLENGCFAVCTDEGIVAGFSKDGLPLDASKTVDPSIPGRPVVISPLAQGHFVILTDSGSVHVFDQLAKPIGLPASEVRVAGTVTRIVSINQERFAVGTDLGVVSVFENCGSPVEPKRTQEPIVEGCVCSMIDLEQGRFAVATTRGVVAVFDQSGSPFDANRTRTPSVTCKLFQRLVALEAGRVASVTSEGSVTIFDTMGVPMDLGERGHLQKKLEGVINSSMVLDDGSLAVGSSKGQLAVFDGCGRMTGRIELPNVGSFGEYPELSLNGVCYTSFGYLMRISSNQAPVVLDWIGAPSVVLAEEEVSRLIAVFKEGEGPFIYEYVPAGTGCT
ncbi:MAG: AAA family ATPase [Methanoregulaceae archaeon]|nr:AAA family ATPase [Methanoregulaceae archaeon]